MSPNGDRASRYPAESLDLERMDRVLRHRLRNLCSGMRMAVGAIEDQTGRNLPDVTELCGLMRDELDDLLRFTQRMDLLFAPLPPAEEMRLRDLVDGLRDTFARRFPLAALDLEGSDDDAVITAGTLYRIAAEELLCNAGEETAARGGEVKVVWRLKPRFELGVVNTGDAWPDQIPWRNPLPFMTARSRHDGLGLAIVHRVCDAIGASLDINTRIPGVTVAKLSGPEEHGE